MINFHNHFHFPFQFRSIHHIHQHVFVNQQSSLCDHCRQPCTTEDSGGVTAVPSPPKDFQIPNIEISHFDNEDFTFNVGRDIPPSITGIFFR